MISCRNICSQNANHKAACDDYMLHILHKMEQTARETLAMPNAGDVPLKSIPRWNENIEPYRKDALFWHSVWLSAGRPLLTPLHRVMKRTRNVYHLHICKNMRMLDKIKKDKLLDACLNNQNGIFTEIKAMRKNTVSFANTIDGNRENIHQYFANKHEKLYNSVNDEEELRKIKKEIHQRTAHLDIIEVLRITPRIVKEALNKLSQYKSDHISEIVSDYLINAPDILYTNLSNIMRTFIIHGHLSSTQGCNLLPIIKDKLAKSEDSNDYQAIAISSVVLKLFNWVIILLYKEYLHLDTCNLVINLTAQLLCVHGWPLKLSTTSYAATQKSSSVRWT